MDRVKRAQSDRMERQGSVYAYGTCVYSQRQPVGMKSKIHSCALELSLFLPCGDVEFGYRCPIQHSRHSYFGIVNVKERMLFDASSFAHIFIPAAYHICPSCSEQYLTVAELSSQACCELPVGKLSVWSGGRCLRSRWTVLP